MFMEFVRSMAYPEELYALFQFRFTGCEAVMPKCNYNAMSHSLRSCYDMLNKTSRSFAAVIQALDGELRDASCLFYLALRSLDTVEDDMTIPIEEKIPLLKCFYTKLEDPEWKKMDSSDKNKIVLEQFPLISKEYRKLNPGFRTIISDIVARMGEGMAHIMELKVNTMEEYDLYCHYVAGLVGHGLVRIFHSSGVEDEIVGKDLDLANKIGVFLQRTNIIRDYLEDFYEGRIFWPKVIWSKYVHNIGEMANPANKAKAVQCLNELVTNAIELVPDSLLFMSRLKNQTVFNYIAIPQVMAIATLERCYNNPKVFTSVVKIRKGEAVRMMLNCNTMEKVKGIMRHFVLEIHDNIPENDPSSSLTRAVCHKALKATEGYSEYKNTNILPPLYAGAGLVTSAIGYTYWNQISQWYNGGASASDSS